MGLILEARSHSSPSIKRLFLKFFVLRVLKHCCCHDRMAIGAEDGDSEVAWSNGPDFNSNSVR
jgi:hypothetical protein